jgi:hydroxyacylglutathione hydrolase
MATSISIVVVGTYQVNCYLYWDNRTKDGVIIDPGDNADEIIAEVKKAGFVPRAILLTHGHVDHIVAVEAVKREFTIPLVAGKGEQQLLAEPSLNFSTFHDAPISITKVEQLCEDEEIISFGSLALRVLSTPGHTPGGVCYLSETDGILFCGDTLFQGSIGRTDLPGGETELLIESIQKKILTLPDAIVCYPGHGPRTTVGAERRSNPFLTGAYFA